MQQTTLETTETHKGIFANEFCRQQQGDAGLLQNTARILDDLIPLRGASHADVVEYRVEIPMRYAECHALLTDGRKVRLVDSRKFLGWSSHDSRRSLGVGLGHQRFDHCPSRRGFVARLGKVQPKRSCDPLVALLSLLASTLIQMERAS